MRVAGELTALTGDLSGAAWFSDAFAPVRRRTEVVRPAEPSRGSTSGSCAAMWCERPRHSPSSCGRCSTSGSTRWTSWRAAPRPRPSSSSPPAGLAQLHCTVHNDRRDAVRGVRPHVGELVSDDGGLLAATVDIQPARLDLEPHERATLQIDVAIPIDAERGRYHGLLLVAGLPNAAYPITVEVATKRASHDDLRGRRSSDRGTARIAV